LVKTEKKPQNYFCFIDGTQCTICVVEMARAAKSPVFGMVRVSLALG